MLNLHKSTQIGNAFVFSAGMCTMDELDAVGRMFAYVQRRKKTTNSSVRRRTKHLRRISHPFW